MPHAVHMRTPGGDFVTGRTSVVQGRGLDPSDPYKAGALAWEDVPPNVRRAYRMLARALWDADDLRTDRPPSGPGEVTGRGSES